jgi:hypothetical protein
MYCMTTTKRSFLTPSRFFFFILVPCVLCCACVQFQCLLRSFLFCFLFERLWEHHLSNIKHHRSRTGKKGG